MQSFTGNVWVSCNHKKYVTNRQYNFVLSLGLNGKFKTLYTVLELLGVMQGISLALPINVPANWSNTRV